MRGIGRCAWCVCARRVGWRRAWVGMNSLSVFLKRTHLGVAYCLAKSGLALIQRQTPDWHFFSASQRTLPHLSASAHVSAANTLTLLIKVSATITCHRTPWNPLFPAGIKFVFIMCIGIIRYNSLVGGRARAEAQSLATKRVTLYCTWRPSALTTGPHGQVASGRLSNFECVCFKMDWLKMPEWKRKGGKKHNKGRNCRRIMYTAYYVHGSSMARWKARCRLPIGDIWTFFASYHGWGAMSRYWTKLRCLKGEWVTLNANFRGKGASPTNEFWRQKTRVPWLSYC